MKKNIDILTPKQEKFLRNLNIGASSVMGAWAILQAYLLFNKNLNFTLDLELFIDLSKFDENKLDSSPELNELGLIINTFKSKKVKVAGLLLAFSLITSISHAFQAANINKYYTKQLNKKINYQRWIEYSITSSLMYGAKLLIGRDSDVKSWVPCILLTGLTNIFGLGIEATQNSKNKFIPEILLISGFISQLYPIVISTITTLSFTESLKDFVDYIKILNNSSYFSSNGEDVINNFSELRKLAELFTNEDLNTNLGPFTLLNLIRVGNIIFDLLYFTFPGIMIAQRFTGKKLDSNRYFKTEVAYIFASIFVKTYLVWYLFAGTLQGNRNNNELRRNKLKKYLSLK